LWLAEYVVDYQSEDSIESRHYGRETLQGQFGSQLSHWQFELSYQRFLSNPVRVKAQAVFAAFAKVVPGRGTAILASGDKSSSLRSHNNTLPFSLKLGVS
jgi:hypothetical protein